MTPAAVGEAGEHCGRRLSTSCSRWIGRSVAPTVTAGIRRIRAWNPTAREAQLADLADRLVERVLNLELRLAGAARPRRLLGRQCPLRWRRGGAGDGFRLPWPPAARRRPAVTLYFFSLNIADLRRDEDRFPSLFSAYESGLDWGLAEEKRDALPIAMARQPLWVCRRLDRAARRRNDGSSTPCGCGGRPGVGNAARTRA